MNLDQLRALFVAFGCRKLYAKQLATNDNSKNQVYFAGAVEVLNALPSRQIFAENTARGPSFKALLDFGWLDDDGKVAEAPEAKLILYSQYPEVRFSGFLQRCKAGPSVLMADRQRAEKLPAAIRESLIDRVLFLGVTKDKRVLGYVAAGNSTVAAEFRVGSFPTAFVVFQDIPLAEELSGTESRKRLLYALGRIHRKGWIESKQLHKDGTIKPCTAPQCGGFTLEAELGIPKNSDAEPDFLGWEVKQFAVDDFAKVESSKPITLLTPEPDGGFYKDADVEEFVRKFGYADKKGRADRINFGGRHFAGKVCAATQLALRLDGYDLDSAKILDACGKISLVSVDGEIAASWSFPKLFEHWAQKHSKAVYVPSQRRIETKWEYCYGDKVRLAEGTDSLLLLKAFAAGAMYYDPGIKIENASMEKVKPKKRSQFRVASRDLGSLYASIDTVEVL